MMGGAGRRRAALPGSSAGKPGSAATRPGFREACSSCGAAGVPMRPVATEEEDGASRKRASFREAPLRYPRVIACVRSQRALVMALRRSRS